MAKSTSRNKSNRVAGCVTTTPKTNGSNGNVVKGNYGKVTKAGRNGKNKKAAPGKTKTTGSRSKTKHSSIKDRVAAAKTKRKPSDLKTSKGGKGKLKARKSAKRPRRYFMTMTPSPCGDTYPFLTSVPWFDGKCQGAAVATKGDFPRAKAFGNSGSDYSGFELPGEDLLGFLDGEIAMFSNYVRLSQSELHARQSFLDHVTELAKIKFETTRGKYCKSATDEFELGDVHCHPFGSFATQSVCTFASDVDMCLWGVVPGKKKPGPRTKTADADFFEDRSAVHDSVPILTESSLLRTMNAIDSSSDVAQVERESSNVKVSGQPDDISTESKKEKEADQDDCLFFLDREGTYAESCQLETRAEGGPLIIESQKPGGMQSKSSLKMPAVNDESFQFDINPKGSRCGEDETDSSELPESIKLENKAGSSEETAIEIGDSSDDESENELISINSEEDSADKISAFLSRKDPTADQTLAHEEGPGTGKNDCEREDATGNPGLSMKRPPLETLELSLTSERVGTSKVSSKPSFGPTGKDRSRVVSALFSLTSELRRSYFTHTIECRSKARVPIINCSTICGFEGDICVGGHNGTDTSMYAQSQAARFDSFGPIVLIMKILMSQQNLDKPFIGGLGSFKLYVLVAHHIEKHIKQGGRDRPSEILFSLLYRYGCKKNDKLATDLLSLQKRGSSIACDKAICDLVPVFKLEQCVALFNECHLRLSERLRRSSQQRLSFLSSFIDCHRLREARECSMRRSKAAPTQALKSISRHDSGKVSAGRKVNTVFTKSGFSSGARKSWENDNHARSTRGAILPRRRPDLEAKRSIRNTEQEVIQRGMKNRKNNKKQKRDEALVNFAKQNTH